MLTRCLSEGSLTESYHHSEKSLFLVATPQIADLQPCSHATLTCYNHSQDLLNAY